MANSHANTPLSDHQETLLQMLPYLPKLPRYEIRLIVDDVYDPNKTRSDVVDGISQRASRKRDNMALRTLRSGIWHNVVEVLTSIRRLNFSAKVRSVLWYSAMMYTSDCSMIMLAMQVVGMVAVLLSFHSKIVSAPHYLLSAALVGFRYVLDASNYFETSSSSIVIGTISALVLIPTLLLNHFIFSCRGSEYLVGMAIVFFFVIGFPWVFLSI